MADLIIFNDDAFRASELSESIREIPNQWGEIGEMGLFTPKPIRGITFSIEKHNGHLQLISSSARGTSLPSQARGKRDLRDFRTARFGLKSRITADDVAGIRAYGSTSELMQVADEVAGRQLELRGSTDVTREFLRVGALQGVVKDPDGSTLIDWFDAFGITQKQVDFTFGTAATDLMAVCRQVTRHIRTSLKGDMMTGVAARISPEFTDQLMGHDDFKDRYRYFTNTNGGDPLRDDTSNGFNFGGIMWKEYLAEADVPQEDGSSVTHRFIPAGDARFFPLGTRTTFREINGSADYMGMANVPGEVTCPFSQGHL